MPLRSSATEPSFAGVFPAISAIGALNSSLSRSTTDNVRPAPGRSSIRATKPFEPARGAWAGTVDSTVPPVMSRNAVHGMLTSSDSGT
ncbi:hypothetical protein QX204_24255 [Nocardia sp. PE-7]|nr:hypothetical protein [Nocardia sp. PE-7]WKG13534.1 hypothetical protein QX204_24255 [Nocardia sp. PE-7]